MRPNRSVRVNKILSLCRRNGGPFGRIRLTYDPTYTYVWTNVFAGRTALINKSEDHSKRGSPARCSPQNHKRITHLLPGTIPLRKFCGTWHEKSIWKNLGFDNVSFVCVLWMLKIFRVLLYCVCDGRLRCRCCYWWFARSCRLLVFFWKSYMYQ